jgi:hypothetical protein
VRARVDQFTGNALSPDQERTRIERLWLQKRAEDAGSVSDPYAFQNVLGDVLHLATLHGSALSTPWLEAWNRALGQLQGGGDATAQRRVYWLALCAAGTDFARSHVRAVLETALERLPDAGHRHVIRCSLSSAATRAGDLAAAERWLLGCDPAPATLSLDSAYRSAVATLRTGRVDPHGVLTILGTHPDAFPFEPARALLLGFLRVHALEAVGRLPEAGEQFIRWSQARDAPALLTSLGHVCQQTRARLGMG